MERIHSITSLVFTVIFFACVFSLHVKSAEESLLLYFPFDEVNGDTVDDQSVNGYVGTLSGDAEFTEDGKYNGAISLDGTGVVTVEYDESLDLTGSFTVEAWMYPTRVDGSFRWVMDKSHTNDDLNYLLGISSDNHARFITRKLANDVKGSGPVISPERWYHIAGVQDENSKKVILYLDGVAVGSLPLAGEKTVNDSDLRIGSREGFEFFEGLIDEVAIFTRALTEAEIKKSMKGIESLLAVDSSSSLATTWGKLKEK